MGIKNLKAFFAEHDRDEEGKQVLLRVNGMIKGYDVEKEYEILKHTIVHEKKVSEKPAQQQQSKLKQILKPYAECFNRTNIRRTVGASLPACAQQLSGLAFLNTYASVFFKQCGFENAFLVVTVMCKYSLFANGQSTNFCISSRCHSICRSGNSHFCD